MPGAPQFSLATVVLDCADAHSLADFYSRLFGWAVTLREPTWVLMRCPTGGTGLSFQAETWYRPPVWPESPGAKTRCSTWTSSSMTSRRPATMRWRVERSWPATSHKRTFVSTSIRPATPFVCSCRERRPARCHVRFSPTPRHGWDHRPEDTSGAAVRGTSAPRLRSTAGMPHQGAST